MKNFDATIALVQDVLKTRPCDEWVRRLNEIGIPVAPINTLSDAIDHPHTRPRGLVLDYDHPQLGPLKTIAHPVRRWTARRTMGKPPPLHGAHSERSCARWVTATPRSAG